MNSFQTYQKKINKVLGLIVCQDDLHAKWLNTLSFLENVGARKIAQCEHPTLVKQEMLKHAEEEFRHAHFLKKQIHKISEGSFPTYSIEHILGGFKTFHYLHKLDLYSSRFLSQQHLRDDEIRSFSYCLVTYAIEKRAEELYPLYESILRENSCPIFVKSIVLEEEQHLLEMEREISQMKNGKEFADYVCSVEGKLCGLWLEALEKEVLSSQLVTTKA